MEIVNFFESLAGKWFSQRTTHYLATQSSQAGQSNLLIEFLPPTEASLIQTCGQVGQDPSQVLCGLKVDQDSRLDGESQSIQSSVVMIFLTPQGAGQGRFWQSSPAALPLQGDYLLEQEVLTLNSQTSANRIEERLWFANPNLRMRTSVLKVGEEVQMASFCSEIRLGLAKPSP
ncbi:MAG TPA: phycobiliprotein lyase [Leptolyngbyaceae cyanobacterium M65_K2018_010]|nr:phycobiliprotein lyase [Leptolyngbyaceae cyanobacterium M65_K2018_010]